MKRLLLMLSCCSLLWPQPQAPAPAKGSIRGVVRDETSGAPVPEATVSINNQRVTTTTDTQGRFLLQGLTPGRLQMGASGPNVLGGGFPMTTLKFVTLAPGQEVENLEVRVRSRAQISGLVVDQNDQPVADATVILVVREMQVGQMRYVFSSAGRTDDQGKYTVNAVPGRRYLVMVTKPTSQVEAISDAPVNPRLRRASFVPTYFPGIDTIAGAQVIQLGAGEKRENVDVRLIRAASYCAEGTLTQGGTPAELQFEYMEAEPHSGSSGDGGLFMSPYSGRTGADGKVRVCGLHPGRWRFTVAARGNQALAPTTSYGTGIATITDSDARIVFAAVPMIDVDVQLAWAETPLDSFAPPPNWSLRFQPMTRSYRAGEQTGIPMPKPGESVPLKFFVDDYKVQFDTVPPGVYVKQIAYGNKNLQRDVFTPGSAVGAAAMKVVLAHDGGTLDVSVADKEGKPVADQFVIVYPASATTTEVLAESVVSGQTDQNGTWSSPSLAPGKYIVMGRPVAFDRSPETLTGLLRVRQQAKEVEVPSRGRLKVSAEPISLP